MSRRIVRFWAVRVLGRLGRITSPPGVFRKLEAGMPETRLMNNMEMRERSEEMDILKSWNKAIDGTVLRLQLDHGNDAQYHGGEQRRDGLLVIVDVANSLSGERICLDRCASNGGSPGML